MTYASQFTGGNADDRRSEADRLLVIISEYDISELSQKEQEFLSEMDERVPVSGKQLLWLRDIKDKLI